MPNFHHGLDWLSGDLIEILPAAVYVCNANAIIVACNRRAVEIWGRTPTIGESDEKYCGSHKLLHPDGSVLPHHETPMASVLRTGEAALSQEVTVEQENGARLACLVNITPLFDENGVLIGAVNCFQDLTVQKTAEKERMRLLEELHQAQKMEALGLLTAGITHDFNNFLHVIVSNLDGLQRRFAAAEAPGGADEVLRLTAGATRAANGAATLVQRLLGFAHRMPLEARPLAVDKFLRALPELLRDTVGEAISIKTVGCAGQCRAHVDVNQLETAIVNLAANARDAMPQGGTLTLASDCVQLDDAYAGAHPGVVAGRYVRISIGDTGSGMSAEVLAHASEPFYTTKAVGLGTGLGLSQVSAFIKESGGHVAIESELGTGTTIKLHLQCELAPEAAAVLPAPLPAIAAAVRGKETVLLVEDDEGVRTTAGDMLRALGYTAIEAADAATALRILSERRDVALLFTDIGLAGGMSGHELAHTARQIQPSLRVLYTTGYDNLIRAQRRDSAATDTLSKPFTYEVLASSLRRALAADRVASNEN